MSEARGPEIRFLSADTGGNSSFCRLKLTGKSSSQEERAAASGGASCLFLPPIPAVLVPVLSLRHQERTARRDDDGTHARRHAARRSVPEKASRAHICAARAHCHREH